MTMVRHAVRRDLPELSILLARAFSDDPVWSWIFPDPVARPAGLVHLFELALEQGLRRGHVYALPSSAAIWSPPDVPMFTAEEGAAFADSLAPHLGDRFETVMGGLRSIGEQHPHDVPHFYLFAIGTEPIVQGHGHGGKLLHHVLDRCDEQNLPAYLESSNPKNDAFYEHHGFRARGHVTLPDGPTVNLMWRDPH
jgi:GNAT superfamily N-acetyltransferase